ncbi:MAG: RodZ domain-containing protein [Elusimicrobiota bacterium]
MTLEKEPDPLRRIPTKHTSNLRAEIGALLRAARLKRGQSLDAVAQQTRISKRYLEALENDRFEQFPAIVYLRGFLKSYCEYLEVDFENIWTTLDQSPVEPPEPTQAGPGPAPAPADSAPPQAHRLATPASHAGSQDSSGAAGAISLAVVLALGLIVWLIKDSQGPAPVATGAAPVALQPVPRAVDPLLEIRLNTDAWLMVSIDGRMVFEGRAPRGARQEWKPNKLVTVRTTEPAALDLVLNGSPIAIGAPSPEGEYRIVIP